MAPQCNAAIGNCNGWAGQMATLDQVVAEVGATATIDLDRFYVTGLSTGGEGTWNYADHNPEVDAIVPMASTYAGDASWMPRICNLAHVSVWTFHNSGDPTQPATQQPALRRPADRVWPARRAAAGHPDRELAQRVDLGLHRHARVLERRRPRRSTTG